MQYGDTGVKVDKGEKHANIVTCMPECLLVLCNLVGDWASFRLRMRLFCINIACMSVGMQQA